jgi:hypothetical protein
MRDPQNKRTVDPWRSLRTCPRQGMAWVVTTIEARIMTSIFIGIFAITLCFINAAVWVLISHMPIVAICWLLAAGACIWMQKWSRGT